MLCGVLTKICSSTLQLLGIDAVTFLVICHMSNSAIIKYHYKERKVFRTWRHWTGICLLKRLWRIPLNCVLTFILQPDYCIMVLGYKSSTIFGWEFALKDCRQTF